MEDTGIVLGQAISEALGDRSGITRYGHAMIPMDEALARCAVDLSGRPFASSRPAACGGVTGGFEHELVEEFVRAGRLRCARDDPVESLAGTNAHHNHRGVLQALARSLRMAVAIEPARIRIPSTKGTSD